MTAMTRSRRLSLRARMLILLIAVTGVFLLIMGAVTTSVLSRKLGTQFNADLIAASTRDPRGLADNTGGYLVVAVSRRTWQVLPVTSGSETSQLASALSQLGLPGARQRFRTSPATIALPDGKDVRAVARATTPAKLSAAGIQPPARGYYILVVAHTTDTVASQVSGVVIAELITGGVLLAVLATGGSWLIGRGLRPLDQMASTANEITSRGDLAARVIDAGDGTEVGRRGCAPNRRSASSPPTPRTSCGPR